jgi:hypothetical protein
VEDALAWLVTFSSPYHLAWFLLSTFVLALTLAVGRTERPHVMACVGHGFTVINAAIHVMLEGDGPVYSVHCLWFNALMAYVHWRLAARRVARKEGR